MSDMLFRQNLAGAADQDAVAGVYLEGLLCVAVINSKFDQNSALDPLNSYGATHAIQLSGSECQELAAKKLPAAFPAQQPPLFDPFDQGVDADNISILPTSFDMRDTIVTNNVGGIGGGLVFASGYGDDIAILRTTFVNNTSTAQNGGGLYGFYSPSIYVAESTFTDQHALLDGGAACAVQANLHMYNSSIRDSSAGRSGGGVTVTRASLGMSNCTLSNNTAEAWGGGAVGCTACKAAMFLDSTFTNNTSHDVGGVLRADPETVVVSMQNVTASGNT